MSTDPITRLPGAFGNVLARLRRGRNWSLEEFANTSGLPPPEIQGMEDGSYVPTLQDFFRIASALGESPVIFLLDVIAAWRADPADYGLYKSRPSELARIYRLGYFHDPGDFRETPRVYESLDHAITDAREKGPARANKGKPPIDTLTIYVRVGYIRVDAGPETELPQCWGK